MRPFPTAVLLAAGLLAVPGSVLAIFEQCGTAAVSSTQNLDAIEGIQRIRTDPATVVGVGYVHPTQADVGAAGGDFVAIGTANGAGVDNCANDYDPEWTIYTDGEIGGVYFCNDHSLDVYAAGSDVSFMIRYTWCASQSSNRWVMTMGGTVWACYSATSSASRVSAFIETTGSTTDRNIDVMYTSLEKSRTGTFAWEAFGDQSANRTVFPLYSYRYVSTGAFDAYLAPMN